MTKEVYSSNTAISMADFDRSRSELDAASTARSISFTKFTDTDKKTAKSYELVDGVITKLTAGNFYNGTFETININYTELPNYIKSMEAGEFIVQGVHQSLPSGNCPADATRAKDLFPFADQAGLLIIDSDSINQFNGIANYDDLTTALNIIEPALAPAMKFCISSASSYVEYNGENSGLRGVHTYIPVDTTLDNKAIIETLHARSVIAGYAYPKITKSGSVKINSFIDTALKTSNQPVFEGGAILKDPAITQLQQYQTYEGHLLNANSIKPLTDSENTAYKMIVADLKESVAEQANAIKLAFVKAKSKTIIDKYPELSDNHAENIAKKAIMNNELYGQFTIQLGTGEIVTVHEILCNPKKYHGVACVHPMDDDVIGKSLIYTEQKKPCIHTFAHGEEVFYLHPDLKPMPDKLYDSHIAAYIGEEVKGVLCYDSLNLEWYARPIDGGVWHKELESKVKPLISSKITKYIDGYSLSRQNSIIKLLTQNIPAPNWECETDFVPLLNGIYDVKKGQLLPYSNEFNFCWQLPYSYDPAATMPVIQQWLNDCGLIQDEIEDIRAFFLMILIGDGAQVQKFLELTGSGSTGKSTLIRLLQQFIGHNNVTVTDLQQLEKNRFECASFYGKRLVLINDSAAYSESCENLKRATGGDDLRFEEKNIRKAAPFIYHGFIVVVANQPIQSSDYSTGLSRRRFPMTFNRVITDEEKSKWNHLPDGIETAMYAELSGLFNWVMGLSATDAVGRLKVVTRGLSNSMRHHLVVTNKIIAWIDECLIIKPDSVLLVGPKPATRSDCTHQKLYESYYWYCIDNGISPLGNNNFSRALQEAAIATQIKLTQTRTSNGSSYQGLAIREDKHKNIPTPVTLATLADFDNVVRSASCGHSVFDDFSSTIKVTTPIPKKWASILEADQLDDYSATSNNIEEFHMYQ